LRGVLRSNFAQARGVSAWQESIFAQAKVWSPGENGPGAVVLFGPISLKREDFHSSERDSRSS